MRKVRQSKLTRDVKSWVCANIIIDQNLIDDFVAWRAMHPKVKSAYRAGSLFLLNRKIRYMIPKKSYDVNMDNLRDWYYGD